MTVLVAVGISVGGALGALARWRLDVAVREWLLTRANAAILRRATPTRSAPAVPAAPMLGIGVVNVLGCLFIGLITGVVAADSPAWLVLSTGFLGGFTTFSTAVVDVWTLWRARRRASPWRSACGRSPSRLSLSASQLRAQFTRCRASLFVPPSAAVSSSCKSAGQNRCVPTL